MTGIAAVVWAALALQAPPPDSLATTRTRAALDALRDSLSVVRGASTQFRADLRRVSAPLVVERSERMGARCAGALAAADSLAGVLAGPPPIPSAASRHIATGTALRELRSALRRCVTQHRTDAGIAAADSLRAWGPHRHRQLLEAVRRYELTAVRYRAALSPE